MRTIKDFADKFGVSAIARRHFSYNKPVTDKEMGGYSVRGALTYMRALEHNRLGLTFKEGRNAYEQGEALIKLGVLPQRIIAGTDQRNYDGARFTAEALTDLGHPTAYYTSPAVTYPHYTEFGLVEAALRQFEDFAVHRTLAGQLTGLWSEPVSVFEARIIAGLTADYGVVPILFDLNFEQITLLYFRLVQRLELKDIPFEAGAWKPKMGGGVVISADRQVAREFLPNFTIAE